MRQYACLPDYQFILGSVIFMQEKSINFLTAKDISIILKICYQKALNFIKFSGIEYIKIGQAYRVEESKFYDFILNNGTVELDLEELEYQTIKKKGDL